MNTHINHVIVDVCVFVKQRTEKYKIPERKTTYTHNKLNNETNLNITNK